MATAHASVHISVNYLTYMSHLLAIILCADYIYLNGLTQSTYTKLDKVNKKSHVTASIAPRPADILNLLAHMYGVE